MFVPTFLAALQDLAWGFSLSGMELKSPTCESLYVVIDIQTHAAPNAAATTPRRGEAMKEMRGAAADVLTYRATAQNPKTRKPQSAKSRRANRFRGVSVSLIFPGPPSELSREARRASSAEAIC